MKKTFFILLLALLTASARGEIADSFYPEVIELKQINGAEKERLRLCQAHKKYDKQPTGFYIAEGRELMVNVEIITPADGDVMPSITVGTLGFNVGGRNTGTTTTLDPGLNSIRHSGGLIWLSFVQNDSAEPKGVAKITFVEGSQHERAPRYVKGKTTNLVFGEMFNTYQTPDVLFESDYVVAVATREAAGQFSLDENKVTWMNSLHTLLELEDEISGLDNDDPNPLHHRLKAGEIRHLLVENTSESPHAAGSGYTGYPRGSRHRYLTTIGTPSNGSWMLGHELGHQHQQPAYMIRQATESTVNIYSYVVERNIQGPGYNRTPAKRWIEAKAYLQLPLSKRVYDMNDKELEGIVGFNRDELRFMPWEQLFLIFGDEFYHKLHRVVREEKVTGGDPDERRAYLIWKASQVTGYDLTEFFNQWGIRVTDSAIKANLRAKMAHAKSESTIFDLSEIGLTPQKLISITGQVRPDWAPISLRGINYGVAPPEALDRSGWTITASHAGPSDNTVGGNNPEYIIDQDPKTAFAFVKPGKSYGGVSVPEGDELWFKIDMGGEKEFNFIKYMHRYYSNNLEVLRARQISIYGSNDDAQFLPIVENYEVDYTKNADELNFEFSPVSYRYIKVTIDAWNTEGGSTVQVADFQAGTKVIENYPEPEPLKFRVTVTAEEGVETSNAGTTLADEDSDFTISFTLEPDMAFPVVLVDGEAVEAVQKGESYTASVKVVNHLKIEIKAFPSSGTQTISEDAQINIYPNPVKAGQPFSVSLNEDFAGAEASIYNLSGMKLFECKLNGSSLSIGHQGMYILKIKKGTQELQTKIVVR